MSNRRQPRNDTTLDSIAATIGDQRVPGGCEDCDAYQTFEKERVVSMPCASTTTPRAPG